MKSPLLRLRAGMTLIEMMVALLIFSFVTAGAMLLLKAESQAFSLGSERVAMYQNGRFAINEMEKDLRTSGAGAPDIQPQLVYIADSVIVFNANYWTNTLGDVEAVYYNPDAPDSAVAAMRTSSKITIPFTATLYPDTNYMLGAANSASETIVFWFARDTSTARTDDFTLWRRVNNIEPEIVASNLLKTSGRAFFEYFKVSSTAGGVQSMSQVAANVLPWRHTRPIHLAINDTGTFARIDSIRAVRINFTVTNGQAGTTERTRALSRLIRLPNLGLVNTRSCGDLPIFASTVTAANSFASDSVTRIVRVTFSRSVDEITGERDVDRYVIWRRPSTETDWGDPYVVLPGGSATYVYSDPGIVSGISYYYAVAAQDCTPSMSPMRASAMVTIP
ncbi:MAG: prepilin-type N-terminal cleavage/methylation domain-containing protein [Gemmatimonadetes bacterium]|nr:prepilin-type N-terminal cleavage/methylation domain-containing protein [Gemmatimonadota bacterium]